MKLRRSSVLAAALVVASAGPVLAEERIEVKVPFAFQVQGQELPAGRYEVRVDEHSIISLHGEDNGARALVFSMPAEGSDPLGATPALLFTRNETRYRLSAVWDGIGDGQALLGQRSGRRQSQADAGAAAADAPTYVLAASSR